MKIYKNFDEISGKVWKTIEKMLQKLKKQLIRFKYVSTEILKKI